jgi:two-component sensor histidine kinase
VWGFVIKRILRSRLPERLAGKVPPALTAIAIGFAFGILAVLSRYALTPIAGNIAPYAFVFAAVTVAAILAGWRSGLTACLVGQYLSFVVVVAPGGVPAQPYQPVAGLIISTISQLIVLVTIALYQREVDKGTAERDARLRLLDDALREIDHRTRNNYQTVLSMVLLQSRRSADEKVRLALQQVADRIEAVAAASQQLTVHSQGLEGVRLDDHLCGLVSMIERGLSRDEIKVECEVDDVTASADAATSISIIVNELVTNALKHAFNGEGSGHVWVKGKAGSPFELIVADDGRGMNSTRRDGYNGLGSRLVESFARQLGAAHEIVSSDKGTAHRLVIPKLD